MQTNVKEQEIKNNEIVSSPKEKKINFVLFVKTESKPPSTTNEKTSVEQSPLNETMKFNTSIDRFQNDIKENSTRGVERLLPHAVFNARAIFIPSVSEGYRPDNQDKPLRVDLGNHKTLLKLNNTFLKQNENNNMPF